MLPCDRCGQTLNQALVVNTQIASLLCLDPSHTKTTEQNLDQNGWTTLRMTEWQLKEQKWTTHKSKKTVGLYTLSRMSSSDILFFLIILFLFAVFTDDFEDMPYEEFGIIKVPERSARVSACIAVCYLHVPLYRTGRAGPRTDCSTVLGVFTGQCHKYNVIKGSHAYYQRTLVWQNDSAQPWWGRNKPVFFLFLVH